MTCTLTGSRVKCTCRENTNGSRYRFVSKSQCKRWDNPNAGLDLPIVDLAECVHRGVELYKINCGCTNNPVDVPVCACELHAQCVPSQYDRIAEKLRGQETKPKACTGCRDVWIPELEQTDIIYVHYNPCRLKQPVANLFRWWETLGPLQRITRGVHLVFDDNEPTLPNAERIKATDGQRYFIKEALINYAAKQSQARYIAWVDADITFRNSTWIQQGVKLLDRYKAVQLWERLECPVPDGRPTEVDKLSAASEWVKNQRNNRTPGGAWVMERETFDAIGGLPEYHLTGGGDSVLWSAMLKEDQAIYWNDTSEQVRAAWTAYRDRVSEIIDGKIGFVPETTTHLYHGTRSNRRYMDRTAMLRDLRPETDIRIAANGLPELVNESIRAAIAAYMQSREEDDGLGQAAENA